MTQYDMSDTRTFPNCVMLDTSNNSLPLTNKQQNAKTAIRTNGQQYADCSQGN